MNLSLNEVESTVWKAARGVGLAWGLAEELGQAARWMADRGLDWAEPVVACLDNVERRRGDVSPPVLIDHVWQPVAAACPLNPVLCGPLISDLASGPLARGEILRFGPMAHPILLLPFVARAAEALDAELTLAWPDTEWLCSAGDTRFLAPKSAALAQSVTVGASETGVALRSAPMLATAAARRIIAPALLQRLEKWVRLTYVPASAESRRMGAGAGLTDND